jgi:hypothetical protein
MDMTLCPIWTSPYAHEQNISPDQLWTVDQVLDGSLRCVSILTCEKGFQQLLISYEGSLSGFLMVMASVAAAKAEFFSISCNKLCKITKIIM